MISILTYCGDGMRNRLSRSAGKKPVSKYIVLYYHAIREDQRGRFAKQLHEVKKTAQPFSIESKRTNYEPGHHIAITFDDGFASFLHSALPELIKHNIPFTIFVPTGYIGQPPGWIKKGSQRFQPERIMNEEELRKLSRLKIAAICSHCITHRNLENLTEDEARDEIFRSKADLERFLGKKVTTLSFPHGGYRQIHIDYAREAGYERVFSITPSLAFQSENEYVTGRINCDPNDWPVEFYLKIRGAYRWRCGASNIKSGLKEYFLTLLN